MKAAVIHDFARAPRYQDFDDPLPSPEESLIYVRASALSHLTRNRAAGTHYSSGTELNFNSGVVGVGRLTAA